MFETFIHWIALHAYGGLFTLLVLGIIGLPIPDEVLLMYSGYLAYKGNLNLYLTMLTALLGSICGITLSYGVGRTVGFYLVKKYGRKVHITSDKLNRIHIWLDHRGKWSLFFGFFIPGIRQLLAYVAGVTQVELHVFTLFTYTGCLIWSVMFIVIGYYLGERWAVVSEKINNQLLLGSLVIIGFCFLYFLSKRFIFNKNRKPAQ